MHRIKFRIKCSRSWALNCIKPKTVNPKTLCYAANTQTNEYSEE